MTIFTICSNNYLAQAKVLGDSLRVTNPDYKFIVFLCDEFINTIDYVNYGYEIIEIKSIEIKIYELAKKYNIIELNTAVKPRVFEYLFEDLKVEKAIYLDPDIFVFKSLTEIENYLNDYSVLLTPHIYTPIPLDEKSPSESTFLNFGIYNLGFISLKNDKNGNSLIKWWKNTTYTNGYINIKEGLFVDQLPMNLVPIFFEKVKILTDIGYNMAPWNLHERQLSFKDNIYTVNNSSPLYFYHFSNFKLNSSELPIHYYNRFTLKNRPDLKEIHDLYNNRLTEAGFENYRELICLYTTIYKTEILKKKKQLYEEASILKKIIWLIKKTHLIILKKIS